HHLEGFLRCCAQCWAHSLDVLQQFDQRLIETKISYGGDDLALLYEKQPVTRHSGHHLFVGIHFADVPDPGYEQPPICASNHLFDRRVAATEDQIHGRLAILIGKRKAVAGRPLPGLLRAPSRVDQISRNASIDQAYALTGYSFPIKRRPELQGMINVVDNGDVFAKELLAHPFGQARTLILECGCGEIVEEKTDKIENRCGLEDDSIFSGRELLRILRHSCFLACASCQRLRIKGPHIAPIPFCPTGRSIVLHGDGKLGAGLTVSSKEASGISQSELRLTRRKYSRRHLAIANRQVAGLFA